MLQEWHRSRRDYVGSTEAAIEHKTINYRLALGGLCCGDAAQITSYLKPPSSCCALLSHCSSPLPRGQAKTYRWLDSVQLSSSAGLPCRTMTDRGHELISMVLHFNRRRRCLLACAQRWHYLQREHNMYTFTPSTSLHTHDISSLSIIPKSPCLSRHRPPRTHRRTVLLQHIKR